MILASASPRRRQLLEEAGIAFRAVPAHIDERAVHAAEPQELVRLLACDKARAVAAQEGAREPVIGSDTIVVADGRVLGKPADPDDARAMLRMLSGRAHEVMTGVCIWLPDGRERTFVERVRVTFYELTDAEIDAYVASGEPMDKAGSYGIQGRGRLLVRGIEGDYYAVVGLPIARLVRELRALGLA